MWLVGGIAGHITYQQSSKPLLLLYAGIIAIPLSNKERGVKLLVFFPHWAEGWAHLVHTMAKNNSTYIVLFGSFQMLMLAYM